MEKTRLAPVATSHATPLGLGGSVVGGIFYNHAAPTGAKYAVS
jgi:hypothetical protein